ncbi:hypothetical protein DVH05_006431 [Phytophthora capsici]|nr:hypothetical protein DVH05_006431 [Phytophthora capsici]
MTSFLSALWISGRVVTLEFLEANAEMLVCSEALLAEEAGTSGTVIGASIVLFLLKRLSAKDDDRPAQSLLNRSFLIEKERPDLSSRPRVVHSEICENYGVKAEVALLVSGPADPQSGALL